MSKLISIVATALMLVGFMPASLVQAGEIFDPDDDGQTTAYKPVANVGLFFESEPGDYIGQGQALQFTNLDGAFLVRRNTNNGVGVIFNGASPDTWWHLNFAAPQNAQLEVGAFENATRWPFQDPDQPGLDFSGSGRGCNTSSGQFQVLDIAYAPTGDIDRLAVKFEQRCENSLATLHGRFLLIYN